MARFDAAFEFMISHEIIDPERTFSDHPDDPGGATNWGISLRYLRKRGDLDGDGLPDGDLDGDGDVDVDDIRAIRPENAKHLYHSGFWVPNRLSEVDDQDLANKLLDMAVNMGSRQMGRLLQRAMNDVRCRTDELIVDGIIGPKTLDAIDEITEDSQAAIVLERLRGRQRDFYLALIDRDPSLASFERGWLNRASA